MWTVLIFKYGLRTQVKANKKWRASYWIDVVRLFEQFLGPNDKLEKGKYFTAAPLSVQKRSR